MKSTSASESSRSFLETIFGWTFNRTHPALHWAIVPILFGLMLAVVLCPMLFVGELLNTGQASAITGAVTILFVFGSASIGGLFGGVLFNVFQFRYDLRLISSWAVSGLIAGVSMATGGQFLFNPVENQFWVSIFFVLGGLFLGLVIGIWFAHQSRQDAA